MKANYFLHLSFILIFTIGYLFLGQLYRKQSYYSPKSSKTLLKNVKRYGDVKLSAYQAAFHDNALNILGLHGFQEGDTILSFYENDLTVYMAGGIVPGPLSYSFEIFSANPENKYIKRPDYIMIVEYQEEPMRKFLYNNDWEFPDSYNRVELGQSAQNLPDPDYNSILFVSKDKQLQ
jgi:hypothetical protein